MINSILAILPDGYRSILHMWKRWLLVAAALLPVAVLAVYAYVVAANSVRQLVRDNNDAAANTTAVLIERELKRSITFAETLAMLPGTINLVGLGDEHAMSSRLKAIVETYDGIDRATLSDTHGIMWSDYPESPDLRGQSVAGWEWFEGVRKNWQPYVTGSYRRHSLNNERVVVVAAPIRLNEKPIGVIAIHYRLETLAEWLSRINVGANGVVIVLDSKGSVVIDPRLNLQAREYTEYADLEPVRTALAGRNSHVEFDDVFAKTKMVASFVPVDFAGRRWVVVAQQPKKDAYAPITALRYQIAIAGCIVALLAFAAAISLGRMSLKVDRLNAELKERNHNLAQLAQIVQSSNDAILSTTRDGIIASWNPGAERMFGFSAAEAVGKPIAIYIPAYLAGEAELLIGRAGSGERIEKFETVRITKDGRELIVSLSVAPLQSESGAISGTTSIVRDVTEQRRAESERARSVAALRESIDRFTLVSKGTNDGLWDWNIETQGIYFSPRWKEMLGYCDDEIDNRFDEWENRLHPDDRDRALVTLQDYVDNRTKAFELEHRLRHKDGTYRWILARGFALRYPNGKAYRMAGSHVDLTQRKLDAEELANKAKELARSNAELEQFAYVASHDLREPLRMIGSFGQHLAKRCKGKLDSAGEAYLAQVLSGAERMKKLIDDLLEFSRVGMKGKPFESVDCNDVLAVVRQNLKVAIEESCGTIVSAPLPTLRGDHTQLTQVFQNLIGNALKFKGTEAPRVNIGVEKKGGQWHFTVADNGIGIDAMHFKRIFAIFARLHTREEYPGTGIGLALVKRIIERHGGTVWVESEVGHGTTFHFEIPENGPPKSPTDSR